jgi:hypothetical protein
MMERTVYDALVRAGDEPTASLWRRLCQALGGPLRIGLVARDLAAARRWSRDHTDPASTIEWVSILLDDEPDVLLDLGGQDRLLGVHALLFLTPMTAPLGQAERQALEGLAASGSPEARRVAIVDEHLLERLSDDPASERAAVYARVEALVPDGWPVARSIDEWLRGLTDDLRHLRARRREAVASFLLASRQTDLDTRTAALHETLARVEADLGREDAALAEERREARRLAAHTLAIVRRQTERLELDLAEFLRQLEADLPAQIHALDDVDLARRTVPHWLTHVVETWMTERLAAWQTAVLDELDELELPDAVGLELLVPALQPAPVKGEARWTDRLGTTAAFGGAAALLMLGMWIPGFVALAGGFALSSVFRGPTDAENRGKLVATAKLAVRQMGEDASRLLEDQLDRLGAAIDALAEDPSESAQRTAARQELEERRAEVLAALDEVQRFRDHLALETLA